jgi:hypothetical protein
MLATIRLPILGAFSMYQLYIGPKALNFPNSDKPGAFKLASKLSENVVNAGSTVTLEQYITGYGANSGFKIICYISAKIFDESESILISALLPPDDQSEMLRWGSQTMPISNGGHSLTMSMMKNELWPKPEAIFDIKENLNFIITERSLPAAPFTYKLKIRKDAKPGLHFIVFYMTYFNGSEWICEEERVSIKINSTFERYNTLISALAAAALIVTIIHDGIAPVIETFHDWGKAIDARHQK